MLKITSEKQHVGRDSLRHKYEYLFIKAVAFVNLFYLHVQNRNSRLIDLQLAFGSL